MLAVYGELFTSKRITLFDQAHTTLSRLQSNNLFYEIIIQTTKGIEK